MPTTTHFIPIYFTDFVLLVKNISYPWLPYTETVITHYGNVVLGNSLVITNLVIYTILIRFLLGYCHRKKPRKIFKVPNLWLLLFYRYIFYYLLTEIKLLLLFSSFYRSWYKNSFRYTIIINYWLLIDHYYCYII